MACDRFIYFDKGKVPPRKEVGQVLEDYLGDVLVKNRWHSNRWIARIVGNKSWPLRRTEYGKSGPAAKSYEEEAREQRWIEVVFGEDNIDVLTRRQDELVNAIAAGFAKLVARWWSGQLEDDK